MSEKVELGLLVVVGIAVLCITFYCWSLYAPKLCPVDIELEVNGNIDFNESKFYNLVDKFEIEDFKIKVSGNGFCQNTSYFKWFG